MRGRGRVEVASDALWVNGQNNQQAIQRINPIYCLVSLTPSHAVRTGRYLPEQLLVLRGALVKWHNRRHVRHSQSGGTAHCIEVAGGNLGAGFHSTTERTSGLEKASGRAVQRRSKKKVVRTERVLKAALRCRRSSQAWRRWSVDAL